MYAVFRLQLQTTVLEMLWVDGESSGAERKFSRSLFYQNMVCYSQLALMYTYRPKRFLVYITEYVYIRSCRTKYTSLSNVGEIRA